MRVLLAILAVLALPATAWAQNQDDSKKGIYFELRGGASQLSDSDLSEPGPTSDVQATAEFDTGYVIEGAIGYEHSSGFRGEVEVGYRKHELDSLKIENDGGYGAAFGVGSLNGLTLPGTFAGVSIPAIDAEVENISVMVNGYYAFDTGTGFKPFVGAGIGAALINLDASFLGGSIDEDSTEFAYKGMAGVEYEFATDLGPISIGVRYEYFATTEPDFSGTKADYESHNILAGIRFTR